MESALYAGELKVRHPDGGEVTYRSVEELKAALAEARASQALDAGTRRRVVRLYDGSDK